MPTDADLDVDSGAPQDDPTPAPAPTPQFDMGQVQEMIRSTVHGIIQEARQQQPRPQPVEEPLPPGATDEEFSTDTASAVRKELQRFEAGLRRDFNQFARMGMERIGNLTQSQMATQLPYYNLYKAEIDAELRALRPELQADPTTIRLVHDNVAMRHDGERLEAARKEAARAARGDAPVPSGNTGRGKAPEPGVPTPEELGFNADQIDDIERRGGPDRFAQLISNGRYANWTDYAKSAQNRTTAPRKGRGNIIPFTRAKVVNGQVVADGDIINGPSRAKG